MGVGGPRQEALQEGGGGLHLALRADQGHVRQLAAGLQEGEGLGHAGQEVLPAQLSSSDPLLAPDSAPAPRFVSVSLYFQETLQIYVGIPTGSH